MITCAILLYTYSKPHGLLRETHIIVQVYKNINHIISPKWLNHPMTQLQNPKKESQHEPNII